MTPIYQWQHPTRDDCWIDVTKEEWDSAFPEYRRIVYIKA